VLELKNFSQFAVISATAAAVDAVPGAEEVAVAGDEAADEVAGALDDEAVAGELELLLQAAAVAARARPSAAPMIWRASRWDRMTRLLVSVGCAAARPAIRSGPSC
jgi:hypothetical protein